MISKETMARHIARVCKVEDIELVLYTGGGRASRKRRRIRIRPVKSHITYAIALHEIGHILGPRQTKLRLEQEVGAWEWAIENALVWTQPMGQLMQRCLRSYKAKAERSPRWRTPATDHPIHALLNGE